MPVYKKKKEKKEREEVTCFKHIPRPQVNLHKRTKLEPVPEGQSEERTVLTSQWSALECAVLTCITRDIPTLNQLSHATSLPILVSNWRVGEGKGRTVLRCCHPHGLRSGTITPLSWGGLQPGRGGRLEILTKLLLPSRINKHR